MEATERRTSTDSVNIIEEEPCSYDQTSTALKISKTVDTDYFSRKIAYILRQIVMYYFANIGDIRESSFVVDEQFTPNVMKLFQTTKILTFDNETFIRNSKMVVPSEQILPRLIRYYEIYKNDDMYVETFKNAVYVMNEYIYLTDFGNKPNCILFRTKSDVYSYYTTKHGELNVISTELKPHNRSPYALSLDWLGPDVLLVQNTSQKDLEHALMISKFWDDTKRGENKPVNLGWANDQIIDISSNPYVVYSEHGIKTVKPIKPIKPVGSSKTTGHMLSVLQYANGDFAAVLRF